MVTVSPSTTPASIRTDTVVPADELALEFLMNALRLREGASVAEFEARTGLAYATIASRVDALRSSGLMVAQAERLCTTARGYRYLNAVLGEFA